jgi:hypothetical protein
MVYGNKHTTSKEDNEDGAQNMWTRLQMQPFDDWHWSQRDHTSRHVLSSFQWNPRNGGIGRTRLGDCSMSISCVNGDFKYDAPFADKAIHDIIVIMNNYGWLEVIVNA